MKNISQCYIDESNTESMISSANITNIGYNSSSKYYTELGFKISNFRVSVRIPSSDKNSTTKPISSYYKVTKRSCVSNPDNGLIEEADNDWEWKPSPRSTPNTSPKVLRTSTPLASESSSSSSVSSVSLMPYDTFQSPIHRTLKQTKNEKKSKMVGIPVAPPIPPRSKSPSIPPLSAQPPYPSSTVQRKCNYNSNKFVTDQQNKRNLRQYSYV
jgi:hypothetical protein